MHDSLLRHSRKRLLWVSIHSYILLSSMYSWFDSLIHEHSHYLKNTIASQKNLFGKAKPLRKTECLLWPDCPEFATIHAKTIRRGHPSIYGCSHARSDEVSCILNVSNTAD